jgi:hypothetical protein
VQKQCPGVGPATESLSIRYHSNFILIVTAQVVAAKSKYLFWSEVIEDDVDVIKMMVNVVLEQLELSFELANGATDVVELRNSGLRALS